MIGVEYYWIFECMVIMIGGVSVRNIFYNNRLFDKVYIIYEFWYKEFGK